MQLNYTQEELLSIIQPLFVEGSTSCIINGISPLEKAKAGDIAFLGSPKYKSQVLTSQASLILLPLDYVGKPKDAQVYFRVKNPSVSLAQLCSAVEERLWPKPIPGIHPSAVIDPSAEIDPLAFIGPLCTISSGAKIAKNVIIGAGVHIGVNAVIGESSVLLPQSRVMDYCIVGKRVRLHSGVVVGSDGFGYHFQAGIHKKIPQIGIVIVEDDVEVGSNTTIDRARFSQTRIGAGTKIDNLVQIAHNVEIGKHCIIVSQTGIAGSTTLEDYVIVGGQVGIADHVRIGQGVKIGSQSGINSDIAPGSNVRGEPAYPYMFAQRLEVFRKRLPELFSRVKKIEKTLAIDEPE